jgi:tRNA modification GTPase
MRTFVRILTRSDRGAIAVVRVWGPGAIEVVDSVFRPRRGGPLRSAPPGRLRLGRAGVGLGDEVVAVRLEGLPPSVEIHGHGGLAAVDSVVRALQDAGAVLAEGDPAGHTDGRDRIRAEAMEDLAAAPTLRAAEILLDQSRGALQAAMERLLIDARQSRKSARARLERLIRLGAVGTRLVQGWKVVIAGRPNVGKSRLFNALAGFDRAIVNPAPGVTRDVVSFRTAFGGWPVELSDTAGERVTDDPVENLGIARSRSEKQDADLVLLVLDRSERLQAVDQHLLETTAGALVVANKCDLIPAWDLAAAGVAGARIQSVSAETGQGLVELVGAMGSRLVPEPPSPGAAVPFRADHVHGLERARACLVGDDLDGFRRRIEEILGLGASS